VQPLDGRQPYQLGQQRAQRVLAVQVVGAERADHEQPLVGQPGQQEGQHVAARPVRPVQVLDRQQHGVLGGQLGDRRVQRVEQLQLAQVAVVRLLAGVLDAVRHQPGQRGVVVDQFGIALGELVQRLDERQVGQGRLGGIQTAAAQHDDVGGAGPLAQLVQQPRLADASVAGDEHGAGPSGTGLAQCRLQRRQLLAPGDQWDSRSEPRHIRHVGIAHRHHDRRRAGRRCGGQHSGRSRDRQGGRGTHAARAVRSDWLCDRPIARCPTAAASRSRSECARAADLARR
jgi:hypothetical protein